MDKFIQLKKIDYLIIALWILWCFCHSYLISINFINFIKKLLKDMFSYYRLFYNLFSIISFIIIFIISIKYPDNFMFFSLPVLILQIIFLIIGLFFIRSGSNRYDLSHFLGFKQIKNHKSNITVEKAHINTNQSDLVRHPWYIGSIFILWCIPIITPRNVIIRIIFTIYIVIGTLLEERKLTIEFGEKYEQYKKNVPRYFPRLKKIFN